MAEFKLPDLGENIEAGEVINILVAVGDALVEDQPVIELETDKAVIEVPSSMSGTVTKVLITKGEQAQVGQVLFLVDAGDQAAGSTTAAVASAIPEAPAASPDAAPESQPIVAAAAAATRGSVDVYLPELGEGIHSGDVVDILVSVGDSVEEEQGLVELEIDKGVVEMPAPSAGVITAIHVQKGDSASIGQLIVTLDAASVAAPAATPVAASPTPTPAAAPVTAPTTTPTTSPTPVAAGNRPGNHEASSRPVPAAPSVRRLAREIGVEVSSVQGSGPGGRISEADVKGHSKSLHENRGPHAATSAAPLPDFSKWGDVEREPFSNVRRITAQRMTASWSTIPHVTQFDQCDVTELELWRKEFGKQVEKAGAKLTPTAIILKVAGAALRKFPQFNASIDMAGEEIIYKKYCHIGVAVDTKRGLLVPVIRDVDRKSITEISIELGEVAEKTRTGKITIDDMQGGSFTVSNLGGIGGTAFTPIVNAPEVAILGVARGSTQPVYVDGQLQPRMIMPLSLSYDHRVIDGADGARFLRYICQGLESPYFLAFGG
ncbi:MAG: dihydrolipoyllysine-residue acetyltransferase [bacterium]|nr:dihydrolipoyllysine-residue acetyltransferase [bacterium]